MFFRKITGIILERKLIKEKDAIVFILSEKEGVWRLFGKSAFSWQSKNLALFQPGTVAKLWLMTDLERVKVVSGLPVKIPGRAFRKYPDFYLWTLRLIRIFKLLETPEGIWEKVLHLETYLLQNPKTFVPWFTFQFLKEIGFALDLDHCQCGQLLKSAFLEKGKLVCFRCKKLSSQKLDKILLEKMRKLDSPKPPAISLPKETFLLLNQQLKIAKSLL